MTQMERVERFFEKCMRKHSNPVKVAMRNRGLLGKSFVSKFVEKFSAEKKDDTLDDPYLRAKMLMEDLVKEEVPVPESESESESELLKKLKKKEAQRIKRILNKGKEKAVYETRTEATKLGNIPASLLPKV